MGSFRLQHKVLGSNSLKNLVLPYPDLVIINPPVACMAVAASVCPICLDEPQDEAFLEPCFHSFCFACIVRWLESCTRCPIIPPHLRHQHQQQQQPSDVALTDAHVATSPGLESAVQFAADGDVAAAEAGRGTSSHADVSSQQQPRRPAVCPVCKAAPLSIIHHVNLAAADFDQLPILPFHSAQQGAFDPAAEAAAGSHAEGRHGSSGGRRMSAFVPSGEHCKRRRLYTSSPTAVAPALPSPAPSPSPLSAARGAESTRGRAGGTAKGGWQQRGRQQRGRQRVAESAPTESVVRAWMTLELQALMKEQDVGMVVDHLLAVFIHPPATQPPSAPLPANSAPAGPAATCTRRGRVSGHQASRHPPISTMRTVWAPKSAVHPLLTACPPLVARPPLTGTPRPPVVAHLSVLAEAARPFLFDRAFAFAVRLFSFAHPQPAAGAAAAGAGKQQAVGREEQLRRAGSASGRESGKEGAGDGGGASDNSQGQMGVVGSREAAEGGACGVEQAGGEQPWQAVAHGGRGSGEHDGEGRQGAGGVRSVRGKEQLSVGEGRWRKVVVEERASEDVYGELEGAEDGGDDGGDDFNGDWDE
ncbi:unnamed protein product [Closterium sp. NIES-53]